MVKFRLFVEPEEYGEDFSPEEQGACDCWTIFKEFEWPALPRGGDPIITPSGVMLLAGCAFHYLKEQNILVECASIHLHEVYQLVDGDGWQLEECQPLAVKIFQKRLDAWKAECTRREQERLNLMA